MEMPSQEKEQYDDIDHHGSRTKDSCFETRPIVKEAISYWESVQTSPDPSRLSSSSQEPHSPDVVPRRNDFELDNNKSPRKPGSFLQHRRTTSEGGTLPIRKKDLEEVEVNREEEEEDRKLMAVNEETGKLKGRKLFDESAADTRDRTDEKKMGFEERDQEDKMRNNAGGGLPNCMSQEALMNEIVVSEEVKSISLSSDEIETVTGTKEELCFDYCQCCDCACNTCFSSAALSSENVAKERKKRQARGGYGRRWIVCIGFLVVIGFSLKSFYEDQDYEMVLAPT